MDYPRIEWDKEVNAATVYFKAMTPDGNRKSLPVEEANGDVVAVMHFAPDGELIEVELLNAEEQIPSELPVRVVSNPSDT